MVYFVGPALAVQGPAIFSEPTNDTSGSTETSSLLDSIFWMAAPKNRRSIEVNRCRRRNPHKLIKVKNNIDFCPECGHLKQKHVLCGYCYEKVCKETAEIRRQIGKQEGGPFKAPAVETMVLYSGETPSEHDQGKRIIERERKRPSWFPQSWHQTCFKRIASHKTFLLKKEDSLLLHWLCAYF